MAKVKEKNEMEVRRPSAERSDSTASRRPPVVAILGHIDHGKSTLLDYIRKTKVADSEAGGITQHISAYEITHTSKDGRSNRITFLDTPGHEAFTSIRARCANVADLAVLVVSAEDGVKPQTLEVFKNIKECALPCLVVITKIDKQSANIERTKQSMAENEIYVEGYGGDTPVIELSAKTGQGIDEFLDMICLMTELANITANTETLGSGIIIESRHDAKRGIVAVGIIKDGTVRQGLFASSQGATAPIRFLLDAEGNMIEELSFSSPVQIVGWDKAPGIGNEFKTFLKKEEAINFSESENNTSRENKITEIPTESITSLQIILKADTAGSLEAISEELTKLSRERIVPKIILSGIGNINENDVKSAQSFPGALVFGFHTNVDQQAALLADRLGITILAFDIIYELTNKIKELLLQREPKIETEEISSNAKIIKLFGVGKGKQVIGGRVLMGTLKKGDMIKIMRRETEIGRGKVKELQQSKIGVDSVSEGTEFGAMIESKLELAPGDVISAVSFVTK